MVRNLLLSRVEINKKGKLSCISHKEDIMTVYNINLGIGWASSGVEYAQAYRAQLLRDIHQPAKFVFMDMILADNIQHLTENIGFKNDEIIWLYSHFYRYKNCTNNLYHWSGLSGICRKTDSKKSMVRSSASFMRTRDNFWPATCAKKTVPMSNAASTCLEGVLVERITSPYPLLLPSTSFPKESSQLDWAPPLQWRQDSCHLACRWRMVAKFIVSQIATWLVAKNWSATSCRPFNWPNKIWWFWIGNQYWSAYLWRSAKSPPGGGRSCRALQRQ